MRLVASLAVLVVGGVAAWLLTTAHKPAPAADRPTVRLAIPADQLTAVHQSLAAQVAVGSSPAVTHVEYRIDGRLAAVSYAAPFNATLDVSGLTAGRHSLVAIAYTQSGASSQSEPVTF